MSTTSAIDRIYGDTIQISVDRFLNNILPPVPDDIVPAELVTMLMASKAGTPSARSTPKAITTKGRWKGFAQDPIDSWQYGNRPFLRLKGVLNSILKASGHSSSRKYHQTAIERSSRRGRREEYFPDVLLLEGKVPDWSNIIIFGELRKEDDYEDVEDVCTLSPL